MDDEVHFQQAKAAFVKAGECIALENWVQAESWLRSSLELLPDRVSTLTNHAAVLIRLNRIAEAAASTDRALAIDPDNTLAHLNRGLVLLASGRAEHALECFDSLTRRNPNDADAWINKGNALRRLNRSDEALASYDCAAAARPDYAQVWSNRGNVLKDLGRLEEALTSVDNALRIKPLYAEAWVNRATVLNDLRRHADALRSYERGLELSTDLDYVLGDYVHTQLKICDWSTLDPRRRELEQRLLDGQRVATPFSLLSLFDSPALHRECAERFVRHQLAPYGELGTLSVCPRRGKIRLAYFSMDFREHPVAQLISELIEAHDREHFEIHAFSFGRDTRDPWRLRLEQAFDCFLDVRGFDDLQVTRLARENGIDIAFDLGGHTAGARPRIFTERAAPVQVNFLGYPGSWGDPCMDYIVADSVTLPMAQAGDYSEQVVHLPGSFQVNPSVRPVATAGTSRTLLGLPEQAFVFCCLNNTYKILPEVFDSWMRILAQVDDSVLWLYRDNPHVEGNLRKEAVRRGVDPRRLVFADRVPDFADHLARYRLADLFLDTFPYGAHTTGADALWVGLPLLTRAGRSFASRVAASLLHSISLPEMVVHSQHDYERTAVELALDPARLQSIRSTLSRNLRTTSLFAPRLFARRLESACRMMLDRYHAGLSPAPLVIPA